MRFFLASAAFGIAAACSPSTAAPDSIAAEQTITAPSEETRVVAVLSYASWCGSCKALDPKVQAVQANADLEGVEFFALDYSARDADAYYADAETLGVASALQTEFEAGIKTGKLYLVSTASGAIVGRVDKSMDEAAITAAIESAVTGA